MKRDMRLSARSRSPENKRRMRVALLLTCLFFTGCTAAQRANIDDAKCQSAGAKFGTRAYVQCRAENSRLRKNGGNYSPLSALLMRRQFGRAAGLEPTTSALQFLVL